MLNINGKNDSSYRYKMIPVKSTINGKGNGIFTIINNLDDVSSSISQPSVLILKFLSSYFGSLANEEKKCITGSYTDSQIQDGIQLYINRFIICPSCNIPETIPQIRQESKKNIFLDVKCSACGKVSEIKCNNKLEEKGKDFIITYLSKNEWIVKNKGNMVLKTIQDEYNPFDS